MQAGRGNHAGGYILAPCRRLAVTSYDVSMHHAACRCDGWRLQEGGVLGAIRSSIATAFSPKAVGDTAAKAQVTSLLHTVSPHSLFAFTRLSAGLSICFLTMAIYLWLKPCAQ